jgi:DNA-binding IclR family transcriptional regulator
MPAFVPASARTMALFELFSREKRELSNSDIARYLDLPDSSCSDLLHTLHQAGYLMRTARTRRFYPTSRLLHTGLEISSHDPRYLAGQEAVDLLSEKTGETAFCGLLDDGAVKVIAASEGRHPLRHVLKVGERIALHASALGKAILGHLGPEEAEQQLRLKPMRQVTRHTLASIDAVMENVKKQTRRGWYASMEEGEEGVSAYAVGGMIGEDFIAISVSGPAERLNQNAKAYVALLKEIADTTFTAPDARKDR